MNEEIQFYRRFCYPNLTDEEIQIKIESQERFEEKRKEFLRHIIFRTKKK